MQRVVGCSRIARLFGDLIEDVVLGLIFAGQHRHSGDVGCLFVKILDRLGFEDAFGKSSMEKVDPMLI